MIKHIVLFKFEDPKVNVPVVRDSLYALVDKIPEIVSMQIGEDFMHSPRSFDMALLVDCKTKEYLAVYDKHPDHNAARVYIHAHCLESKTVDFEY
jgi:hypothetical protein